MSEPASGFQLSLDQIENYEFRVDFDKEQLAPLIVDEPSPLGNDKGPDASRLLASAVGGCLCASLLFCLGKSRIAVRGLKAELKVQVIRNEKKRLRIGRIDVNIDPNLSEEDRERAKRCYGLFEEFCTVTQSIRDGIDVRVTVPGAGD